MDETKRFLRGLLIGVLVLLALSLALQSFLRHRGLRAGAGQTVPFDSTRELAASAQLSQTLADYESLVAHGVRPSALARDIFLAPDFTPPAQPFVLKSIQFGEVALVYRGRIRKPSGQIIAQVNWGGRTHFVREGDSIKEWLVSRVDDALIEVRKEPGETMTLRYQTVEKSAEPTATLVAAASGAEREVAKGDFIEGYKVLEINQNTVVLSGASRLVLTLDTPSAPQTQPPSAG